jgi:large subunit ribosomal protein L21
MYAIIKSGGKQYRVEKGSIIEVELLEGEEGSVIEFTDILFVCDPSSNEDKNKYTFGEPNIPNFTIKGEILGSVAGPKILSMKYKPSHHQYRRFGHRQHYSQIEITEIGHSKHESKGKGAKHGT